MNLTFSDSGTAVTVSDANTDLVTYVYRPDSPTLESPKPYLDPIRTRAGRVVSLFRPWDHVWHKGIAWSLPVVGDENFWGGPTFVRGEGYVQLSNNGAQVLRGAVAATTAEGSVALTHGLDWITEDGAHLFDETRTISARALDDSAWMLSFTSQMTNTSPAPISIGSPTTRGRENAGYGGLFWRGPRSFTEGVLVTATGTGGDELRGQRHEWMGFEGRHDREDAVSLLVMVDATSNPHHPPQWFARSETFACLNPAPFFSEELVVAPGETASFTYGVGIADADRSAALGLVEQVRAFL